MVKMMTEIQRNDLLSEWLEMSRKTTINNPKKEKSMFRREFEHSKLNDKGHKKRKSPHAMRPNSHPPISLPAHAGGRRKRRNRYIRTSEDLPEIEQYGIDARTFSTNEYMRQIRPF